MDNQNNVTVVVRGGQVIEAFADNQYTTVQIIDLDTQDEDEQAVYESELEKINKTQHKVLQEE